MIFDETQDWGFPLTALREIKYLSSLDHDNIIRIKQVIHSKPSAKNKYRGNYYLLFDYMPYDLTGLIDKKVPFKMHQIKRLFLELLQGIRYLHEDRHIAHRDIKGANILLGSQGEV